MVEKFKVGSEERALMKEKETEEFYAICDPILKEKKDQINKLLKIGAKEQVSDLLKTSEENLRLSQYTEYAYLIIMNEIYLDEKKSQAKHTIFDSGTSIDELITFFIQIKFLLWEWEFFDDVNVKDVLKDLVFNGQVSVAFLKNMILIVSIDKQNMANKITKFLQGGNANE